LNPLDVELIGAYLAAFTCLLLSGLMTVTAAGIAGRRQVKVWLDPAVHRARREDAWPPPYRGRNLARWLLLTTLLVYMFSPAGAALIALHLLDARGAGVVVKAAAVLSFALLLLVGGLRIAGLEPRVVAVSPEECWAGQGNEGKRSAAEG